MAKLTGDQILAWIDRNFGDYKIRKGGQEIVMANPWGDSGRHFNISLVEKKTRAGHSGFWVHDWRPGHQEHDGSFLRFVQEYKGLSFFDALRDVCGKGLDPRAWLRKQRETQEKAQEIPQETELKLPAGARRINEVSETLAYNFAINYLKSRAISIEEATRYFVHYDSVSIIFPYVEFGMVVYWQSRSMVGKQFEFPPDSVGVVKSDFLYGFDDIEPRSTMILCEAIIDTINVGIGAAAIGGGDLSDKQVKKIRALNPDSIILAGDNDKPDKRGIKPGTNSIIQNYKKLSPYYEKIFFAIPPNPYKDWNDMAVAGMEPRKIIESVKKPATLKSIIKLRNI